MDLEQQRLTFPIYGGQIRHYQGSNYPSVDFQFLPSDPRRLGFYISFFNGANTIIISTKANAQVNGGICINSLNVPRYFSRHEMGDVITEEWFVWTGITATTFDCFEILQTGGF